MTSENLSIFSQLLHLSLSTSKPLATSTSGTSASIVSTSSVQEEKVNRLSLAIVEKDACFGTDPTTWQTASQSIFNMTHWTPQTRKYNVAKQNLVRVLDVCTKLQNQKVYIATSLQEHHTVRQHGGKPEEHITAAFHHALEDFSEAEKKELKAIVLRIGQALKNITICEDFPGMKEEEKKAVQQLPSLLHAIKQPSCTSAEIKKKCAPIKERIEAYCDRKGIDYRQCPLAEDIALVEIAIREKEARVTTVSDDSKELVLFKRMKQFLETIKDIRESSEVHPQTPCSDEIEKILEQHVDFLVSASTESVKEYLAREKDFQQLIGAIQQFGDTLTHISTQFPHQENFPNIDEYIRKKLLLTLQSQNKNFMTAIIQAYKTKSFKTELQSEIEAVVGKNPNIFALMHAKTFLVQSAQLASKSPELEPAQAMINRVGDAIPTIATKSRGMHRMACDRNEDGRIVAFRPALPQVLGTEAIPPRMNKAVESVVRVAIATIVCAQFLLLEVLYSTLTGSKHVGLEVVYALGFSLVMGLLAELTRGLPGQYHKLGSVFFVALFVFYAMAKPQAIRTMQQVQVSFTPHPDWMERYLFSPIHGPGQSPGPSITQAMFPSPASQLDWMQGYQLSPISGPAQSPGPLLTQAMLQRPMSSISIATPGQSPLSLPFSLPQSPLQQHLVEVAQKVEVVGFFARMSRLFTGG